MTTVKELIGEVLPNSNYESVWRAVKKLDPAFAESLPTQKRQKVVCQESALKFLKLLQQHKTYSQVVQQYLEPPSKWDDFFFTIPEQIEPETHKSQKRHRSETNDKKEPTPKKSKPVESSKPPKKKEEENDDEDDDGNEEEDPYAQSEDDDNDNENSREIDDLENDNSEDMEMVETTTAPFIMQLVVPNLRYDIRQAPDRHGFMRYTITTKSI